MSALREAAQQALDSINELFAAEQSEGGERGGHIRTPATREHLVRVAQARRALHESCDTLRAALAQPDDWTRCHHCGQTMPPVPLGQAEPAQKPVAVVRWNDIGHISWRALAMLSDGTPPYTAAPQRTMVPLTEDEVYRATKHHGVSKFTAINIARAIEKASWEKNHG